MIPLRDDNPTEIKPFVTIGFLVACVVVFLNQAMLGQQSGQAFVYQYGAIPAVVFGYAELPVELAAVSPYGSLVTSMFLHGGWMHLIGNMLYLWIFGNNIEDVMGHGKFIVFYFLCGVIAALSHAAVDPVSTIPMVGASGAISGILGAYLLLYPRAQVLVLIPLGFSARCSISRPRSCWPVVCHAGLERRHEPRHRGGGVAFFAHIGGFLAGVLLIGFFKHPHVKFFNPPHAHARRWR